MPRPTEKKKFEEKFEKKNGKWEPKPNGGWQTKGGMPFPIGANEEIEPWADSLRIWMCEMNQWAEQVTRQLNEMAEELSTLKTGVGGQDFGDTTVPH